MSLRDGENQDLVGVFVDGSQEVQGQHKEVSALLPQKSNTVDLTKTSNYDPISVYHTDEEEQVASKEPIETY